MAWLGRRFQCGVIFVCVALVGCQSSPSGRYSQRHDSAPLTTPDVSEIPDILPQPVVRTGAGNKSPYEVFGKTYWVMPESEVAGFRQRGYASWYGNKFHGHLTSNGETYDMFELTAAHKSLPIPSYVLVRNLANGKETVVRVNDRGPFHGNRIIDLSWAAASKLGYVDLGVAEVEIVAIDPESYQVMLAQRASQNMPESNLQPPSSAAVAGFVEQRDTSG